MAGGMRGRDGNAPHDLPMAERVRLGREPAEQSYDVPAYPGRHCWVLDPADGAGAKRAGLLLEWRQGATGWEGQVAYLCRPPGRGWLITLEWLPERVLEVAVVGSS